jgi:hypothetical protein
MMRNKLNDLTAFLPSCLPGGRARAELHQGGGEARGFDLRA